MTDRMTFSVPDEVPAKHTTAQLPEGERVPGTVCVRLYSPDGKIALHDHAVEVGADGVIDLVALMPDNPAPGLWGLERGVLIRSMTLLPLRHAARGEEAER